MQHDSVWYPGSPLCQGMKEQLQSRSIMQHCTSPLTEKKTRNMHEVKHKKWAVLSGCVWGWVSDCPWLLPAGGELQAPVWACVQYLMCVAGRLSYCRDRKSSLWRSWCFCFSVSSVSVGLSFSSSSSSAKAHMQVNNVLDNVLIKAKRNHTSRRIIIDQ